MIVAAAGKPVEGAGRPTTLQVLPLSNDADSWPRLMGQLLFAFFGGNRPAVWKLEIEAIHDQLPDDIVEGWATALWGIQACISAADLHKAMQPPTHKLLSRLAVQLYARMGLHPQELRGEAVSRVFAKLNERYCSRLGLSPNALTGPKPALAGSGGAWLG